MRLGPVPGARGLGFRGLGVRGLGFRGSGFRVPYWVAIGQNVLLKQEPCKVERYNETQIGGFSPSLEA